MKYSSKLSLGYAKVEIDSDTGKFEGKLRLAQNCGTSKRLKTGKRNEDCDSSMLCQSPGRS